MPTPTLYPFDELLANEKMEKLAYIEDKIIYLQKFNESFEAKTLLEEITNHKSLLLSDESYSLNGDIDKKFKSFCEKVNELNFAKIKIDFFSELIKTNTLIDVDDYLDKCTIAFNKLKDKFKDEILEDEAIISFNKLVYILGKTVLEKFKVKLEGNEVVDLYCEYKRAILNELKNLLLYLESEKPIMNIKTIRSFNQLNYNIELFKSSQAHYKSINDSLLEYLKLFDDKWIFLENKLLASDRIASKVSALLTAVSTIKNCLVMYDPLKNSSYDLQVEIEKQMDNINTQFANLEGINTSELIAKKKQLMNNLMQLKKFSILLGPPTIIQKKKEINDKVSQLLKAINCTKDVEFTQLNAMDFTEQYLTLSKQHSSLFNFELFHPIINNFFTNSKTKILSRLQNQINRLGQLNESSAKEKYHLLSQVNEKILELDDYNNDYKPCFDPKAAIVKLNTLLSNENCLKLAQHRNTPFKNAFWCLFRIFRPDTTSIIIAKEIKKELSPVNTGIL